MHQCTIDALPTELLVDILQHALTLRTKRTDPHWTTHTHDPLSLMRLSHVCQRWRSLLHSSPRLWSSLRLTFSSSSMALLNPECELDPIDMSRKRRMVLESVKHAHDLPLDLDIRAESLSSFEEAKAVIECSILPYVHRLRSLRLSMTLPRGTTVYSLFSFHSKDPLDIAPTNAPAVHFPLLQSLHLRLWSAAGAKIIYPPGAFFHSPNLSSLTLEHGFARVSGIIPSTTTTTTGHGYGQEYDNGYSTPAFPWCNIQHLSIQGILTSTEFHTLLRSSPHLLSANLTISGTSHNFYPSPTPFTHPLLSNLSLHIMEAMSDFSIGNTLFDTLTLPSLKHFSSSKISSPDFYTPLLAFSHMLQRSRCTLQSLKVDFDDISCPRNIAELAGCSKDLQELDVRFTGSPIVAKTVDERTGAIVRHPDINILPSALSQSEECLWPSLHTLKLSGSFNPDIILSLLRSPRSPSLKRLDLEMPWDDAVVDRLAEMSRTGSVEANFEELEVFDDEDEVDPLFETDFVW